jgi:type IV pilus assembly protein PilQ
LRINAKQKRIGSALIGVFVLMFVIGCAGERQSAVKDPFFEKWNTLAENSQGHSPQATPKKVDIDAKSGKKTRSDAAMGETYGRLPTKPINLTMRQADLKAVLRAMAKSVNYNLIVRNDLKDEVSVDFRGVPWNQAFIGLLQTYGLSYVWEGNVIRVMTIDGIEKELKRKVQLRDIQWVEPLMNPVVIKIDYADAKKLEKTMQGFLTKDKDGKTSGSVTLDEHSNALVISANAQDLAKMIPIIEKLDKPTPQILIKANIVETTKSVARDLGVMWGGMYKGNINGTDHYITPGGTSGTGDPMSGLYSATQDTGISGQGFASNFPIQGIASAVGAGSLGLIIGKIGGNVLEVQLQALQQDNKLNILSSPSITTLDNQKAFTENGEKVPYTTISSSGTGSVPTATTKFEDVVMRLEITPHVIDGKNLKMTISVQKDEVDMTRKSSLGDPYIIKKKTETVLIVQNGETIVISGLTKQRNSNGNAGWPMLKDIPMLGYLFKADSKSDSMEEVLIFITPHILQLASADAKRPALSHDDDQVGKMERN